MRSTSARPFLAAMGDCGPPRRAGAAIDDVLKERTAVAGGRGAVAASNDASARVAAAAPPPPGTSPFGEVYCIGATVRTLAAGGRELISS